MYIHLRVIIERALSTMHAIIIGREDAHPRIRQNDGRYIKMIEENTIGIISAYLQHCQIEKRLSQKTIKAYRIDLMQFSHYIGCDLCSCDKSAVQHYLSLLHDRYKVKSVKRKIASLKAFFTYLVDEHIARCYKHITKYTLFIKFQCHFPKIRSSISIMLRKMVYNQPRIRCKKSLKTEEMDSICHLYLIFYCYFF